MLKSISSATIHQKAHYVRSLRQFNQRVIIMTAVATIVYGIPYTKEYFKSAGMEELIPFMSLINEYSEDRSGVTYQYSGSHDETPAYIGVELLSTTEFDTFVQFEDKPIDKVVFGEYHDKIGKLYVLLSNEKGIPFTQMYEAVTKLQKARPFKFLIWSTT